MSSKTKYCLQCTELTSSTGPLKKNFEPDAAIVTDKKCQMQAAGEKNADILIIGAGPTGLICANELCKAGYRPVIIERQKHIGGLMKTYEIRDFKTDIGPHIYNNRDRFVHNYITGLLGEQYQKVESLYYCFYINGRCLMFPLNIRNCLKAIDPIVGTRIVIDFIYARIRFFGKEKKNFEEHVQFQYGKTLADISLLKFTKRVWGVECSQISPCLLDRRFDNHTVPKLLLNMIKGKMAKHKPGNPFYSCYPSGGSFRIYEAIEKNIAGKSTICMEKEPARISHNGNLITEVTLNTGERLHPDQIVSTIPMNELISLMDPAPPEEVINAMKKLKYRSEVYLFLTIDKPFVSEMSHMYFLDDAVPFTRVTEMKHFSKTMSPPDKTSLFFEFFCWEGDDIWNMSKEEMYEKTIRYLEMYGLLKREEVIDVVCLREKGIYPVFDLSYRDNLAIVMKYLHSFSNLVYAGRMATFQYSSHGDVLKMGVLAARSIIDNKKYNIENPAEEEAVFNSL